MENIQTFFLRVSARCNLNCSYCYVFKHNDESWKRLPPILSKENVVLFANRMKEYLQNKKIKNIYIIFHGGEPLLIGEKLLLEYMNIINDILSGFVNVQYSIQTNGTLITENFIKEADKYELKFSLSIDGPNKIHDKNRKTRNGSGSFERVLKSIKILQKYPHLFQGIIGVINPHSDPDEIFSFYKKNDIYHIDLLLPDANYVRPPIYRDTLPDIYKNWLIRSFDTWFDYYQDLSFGTYENILKGILGINYLSDFFGGGELNYLTIESDGSYHTSDILKVAYENASSIGLSISNASIDSAINSDKVREYNNLLKTENLPSICHDCEVKHICAGGSLPHRYSLKTGFNNPTIYCSEIKALIKHAENRLVEQLEKEIGTKN